MSEPVKPLSEERKALERLICRALIAVLVTFAVIRFAPFLWDKLSPFIICVPIAAMLQPVIRFLEKKCRLKQSAAVVIPVLLLLILFFLLVYWFISFGFGQLSSFISNAPVLIPQAANTVRASFQQLMANFESVSPEAVTWLTSAMNQGLDWLTAQGVALGGQVVSLVTNMATGIPNAFIYLNFFAVGLYFIAKQYSEIRAKLPGGRAHDPNSNASQLTRAGISGALGYLRVQTIYAIISLVAGWVYFSAFQVPYAWLIAICASILEFLPLFGNGTIYIPWSIIAYILGMPRIGTLVLVLYLLLTTFRRITEPKIMSHNIGVSPLVSLIGMFVGLRMGGILGLIGGPIVMTILGAVYHGNYLNGIRKDCRTLISFCRRRWDWADRKPYVPPKEEEEKQPAPEKKPLLQRLGKKK